MGSESYLRTRKNQTARRRFESKILLERLKTGRCKDCLQQFLPCQMDLVRPDGSGPQMTTLLGKSRERMVDEARARDLVCANCGRLRSWQRQREGRMEKT
jgi:hypothetical protein